MWELNGDIVHEHDCEPELGVKQIRYILGARRAPPGCERQVPAAHKGWLIILLQLTVN